MPTRVLYPLPVNVTLVALAGSRFLAIEAVRVWPLGPLTLTAVEAATAVPAEAISEPATTAAINIFASVFFTSQSYARLKN